MKAEILVRRLLEADFEDDFEDVENNLKSLFSVKSSKHQQIVSLAARAAELVLSVFEDACPNDGRPRKAIEAAKAWAHYPSLQNKKLAAEAAAAAEMAAESDDVAGALLAGALGVDMAGWAAAQVAEAAAAEVAVFTVMVATVEAAAEAAAEQAKPEVIYRVKQIQAQIEILTNES
jgi:hypothetical protein